MAVDGERIAKALKNLDGDRALRNLIERELGYEADRGIVSTDAWREDVSGALVGDPELIATAGREGRFGIIWSRLSGVGKLSLGIERRVMDLLRDSYPYALFVFSDAEDRVWHFVNAPHGERAASKQYRRIVIGPDEGLRTATDRISLLSIDDLADRLGKEPEELSPLDVQSAHDGAFDVEAVTTEFFREYRRVFEAVEASVEGIDDAERRRFFVQRLFNRLMFVAFVEKKRWMRLGERTDYLAALWDAYSAEGRKGGFYRTRLKPLFFRGFNAEDEHDEEDPIIGAVPYLNGGLFEEGVDDEAEAIDVPDEGLREVLFGLFGRFNFTTTESTPLDTEVAVDPEMLGKVFEELVTGRHETGSYYTPKNVVSFMSRDALKGFLEEELGSTANEEKEALRRFVEEHDPSGLRDPEAVLDALRGIRVCDPACGSGAYLLGMMRELLDLREKLFDVRGIDSPKVYQRKLEIIQNNIYGVDIEEFAVNIARLRLWLSLVVDYEETNPPPLPNLDFKIETGDSLTAPAPLGVLDMDAAMRDGLVRELSRLKERYLEVHGAEKADLKARIDGLLNELATVTHSGGGTSGFDWQVEFAEVFVTGGFDVVLANPPYVRADAQFKHLSHDEGARRTAIAWWKDYRSRLRNGRTYRTLFEKWDLYVPFLERAYQLLRTNGQAVFIIPDAFNTAKYARKTHEFLLQEARIVRLDFCSEIPLFLAGVQNTIVHFAKASGSAENHPVRVRRWGIRPDDFDLNAEHLPTGPQGELDVSLFRPDAADGMGNVEGTVELEKIFYISVGMVINADEDGHAGEFAAEDLLAAKQDGTHPKRFVLGKDLRKWRPRNVRYLEWGTERAPEHFRRPTFVELHESEEKLVAMRTPGAEPKVLYDGGKLHFDASSVGLVPWHRLGGIMNKSISKSAKYRTQLPEGDREERERISEQFEPKYVLAVMNSSFAMNWLSSRRRSNKHVYPDDWKPLPIVELPAEQQAEFVSLVDAILQQAEQGDRLATIPSERKAELERALDERVAELYRIATANSQRPTAAKSR